MSANLDKRIEPSTISWRLKPIRSNCIHCLSTISLVTHSKMEFCQKMLTHISQSQWINRNTTAELKQKLFKIYLNDIKDLFHSFSFGYANRSIPVELWSSKRNCSSHSLEGIILDAVEHFVQLLLILKQIIIKEVTYLVLYLFDCVKDMLCRWRVCHWYAVKCLLQVELHVTHLKVVATDFQVTWKLASVESPCALPLTSPEWVQFMVLDTDFYYLRPLILLLVYRVEHLSFPKALWLVALCLSKETVSKRTGCNVNCLVADDPAKVWIEWVESEGQIQNIVVVSELALICSVSTIITKWTHKSNLAVWEWNVKSVSLIPFPQRGQNFRVLTDLILTSREGAQVKEHIFDLSSWSDLDQIFECFNLILFHIFIFN